MQIGACGAQTPSPLDVSVEGRKALLAVPVDILGEPVAGLPGGFEEGAEERVGGRAAFEHERTGVATPGVVQICGQACLHALEVGEAVGVVPRLHSGCCGPALVVERVPSLKDHSVDAARTPKDL